MNKYFFALIFIFFTSTIYGLTIEQKKEQIVDKNAHFTIKINYPYFKNGNVDPLNSVIKDKITADVNEFKNTVSQNSKEFPPTKDMPKLSQDSNTLTITYKIFKNTSELISIRFANDIYYYATAHPNTGFASLNYDLKNQKILTLDDLFKPNSNYLQLFADHSQKILKEKLSKAASSPTDPEAEGLQPKPDNYKIWNITPNGILITFPAYQVAAYVFGPQEVLIPNSMININRAATVRER